MAYEAKTQNDLAKWWVIGTGSVVNRLSEIMDDCPLGPAIYYTTGWTASGSEYYRTQATANDSAQEKIGAGAWTALVLGAGIGALNAGEYFYDVGTTRLYVRLTGDAAPNATNQVRAHYVWDGAGAGPAFMTELAEDLVYSIKLLLEVGDSTTSTILTSPGEVVYFDTGVYFQLKSAATLTIGELSSGRSIKPSAWFFKLTQSATLTSFSTTSVLNIYGSIIQVDNDGVLRGVIFDGKTLNIYDSILAGGPQSALTTSIYWVFTGTAITLDHVYFTHLYSVYIYAALLAALSVRINDVYIGVRNNFAIEAVLTAPELSNVSNSFAYAFATDSIITFVDPSSPISTVTIGSSTGIVNEKYTVNVHITDKSGVDLSGVIIDLYGSVVTSYDTAMWTVGSVTTAVDGTITKQTVTAKKWVGTSETETDYNVFELVCSKVGYETLTLENITIDGPIDWHLELQDPCVDHGAILLEVADGDLLRIIDDTTALKLT